MDLEYLLWLQNIRNRAGPLVEDFFSVLSDSTAALVFFSFVIYALFDKETGLFALLSFSFCSFINSIVKITACVYRPWIRDPRIVPAKKSLGLATGYSFPSGHTSAAASFALSISRQKKSRAVAALFFVYVLLVAFSRNFLGCHTPQDVLAALAESLAAFFVSAGIKKFIDKKERNESIFFLAASVLTACAAAYILLKPYPIDTDAAGAVLAPPEQMQSAALFDIAFFAGISHGLFLERRFIKFGMENMDTKKRILRLVLLLFFLAVIFLAVYPALKSAADKRIAKSAEGYLSALAGLYMVPLIFCKIERALKW